MWLVEIPSTFVNSSCGRKTFCQLPLTFRVAKRPVNFHAAWRHSVNIMCGWVTLRQLSSTFCVAVTRSVNFFMWPGSFPSSSVNYPCCRKSFCQLSEQPVELPSTSVDCPYGLENFRQLSLRTGDFPSASVNIFLLLRDLSSTSANYPCCRETFCQLPSTFHLAGTPFVNIRQHSLQPEDLLSSSVKFPCRLENFLQLSSTFRVARRPSVKSRQLFMRLGDMSNSIKFLHGRETFCQHQ